MLGRRDVNREMTCRIDTKRETPGRRDAKREMLGRIDANGERVKRTLNLYWPAAADTTGRIDYVLAYVAYLV